MPEVAADGHVGRRFSNTQNIVKICCRHTITCAIASHQTHIASVLLARSFPCTFRLQIGGRGCDKVTFAIIRSSACRHWLCIRQGQARFENKQSTYIKVCGVKTTQFSVRVQLARQKLLQDKHSGIAYYRACSM